MKKFHIILKHMGLSTLPLPLAGVTLGLSLAASDYMVSLQTAFWTIICAAFLHILTGIANASDKGSETLTKGEVKVGVVVLSLLSIAAGLLMIHSSFGTLLSLEPILMMMLGGAAMSNAIRAAFGRNYSDDGRHSPTRIFTFLGIISVLGAYFVAARAIPTWIFLLPACAMGLLCIGSLNIGSLDKSGKILQTVLICGGWALLLTFNLLRFPDPWHYLGFAAIPLFVAYLYLIWTQSNSEKMQPLLVTASFLASVLTGAGYLIFLL